MVPFVESTQNFPKCPHRVYRRHTEAVVSNWCHPIAVHSPRSDTMTMAGPRLINTVEVINEKEWCVLLEYYSFGQTLAAKRVHMTVISMVLSITFPPSTTSLPPQ